MPTCDYCDEEFDDRTALHVHWGEEHSGQLNSHQQDKVKRARNTMEQQDGSEKQYRHSRRKKMLGYSFAVVLGLGLALALGSQIDIGSPTGNISDDTSDIPLEGQPYMGESDAPVTVVEFGDYQCPHCQRFHQSVVSRLDGFIERGDVQFYYINFPILGPGSQRAAAAGECVLEQDRDAFWEYHDAIFQRTSHGQGWTNAQLVSLAGEIDGVDAGQVEQCLDAGSSSGAVQEDSQIAQSLGLRGTPAVFVDGHRIDTPSYSNLRRIINGRLN